MANENLVPVPDGIYAEPDGCLYTWCPGTGMCDKAGFLSFGTVRHFQAWELGELTYVIDETGKVLVQQLPMGGIGNPGRYSDNPEEQAAFEAGWREAQYGLGYNLPGDGNLMLAYIRGHMMMTERLMRNSHE